MNAKAHHVKYLSLILAYQTPLFDQECLLSASEGVMAIYRFQTPKKPLALPIFTHGEGE